MKSCITFGFQKVSRLTVELDMKKAATPRSSKRLARSNVHRLGEPQWLQRAELTFLRTGKLILNGDPSPDLSLIHSRGSLKELNISKTALTSIEGLASQPNISLFNAENSQLSSFVNFSSISHASIFFLRNTPLAEDPLFYLGIAILSTAENPIVDGKLVPKIWKKRAATFPPFARDLVSAGWKLQFPCPPSSDLRELCGEFHVKYEEDEPVGEVSKAVSSTTKTESQQIDENDYLAVIDYLMDKHEDVIDKATRDFELLDESEDRFQLELRQILEKRRHVRFEEDGDVDLQIITAIRALCLHRGGH
jgi:hypothetical protein